MSKEDVDRGRYVEGDSGAEAGHKPGAPDGRYVEGDYGPAGSEGADPGAERGQFVEADYGTAGDVPGRAAENPKGRYIQSDAGDEKKAED